MDLKAERSAEANAFKARLNHFVRQYTAKAAPAAGAPVPVDTLKKLRSLGYLAYNAPVTTGDGANLPDPKDKIKNHRVILRATALSETGRFPESDRLLRELAPLEPKLYAIPFILGENAFREGHLKEAQRQFLACLNLSPAFSPALIGAARAYHADHQNEKVKPLLQLALQHAPVGVVELHLHRGQGAAAADLGLYAQLAQLDGLVARLQWHDELGRDGS